MGRKKKTVLYKYKNPRGDEEVAPISFRKAKQVESFKNCMRKRATRKGITLPEEENKEK